jgi:hypothetical protein
MKARIVLIVLISIFLQTIVFAGDSINYSNSADYKNENSAISKKADVSQNSISVYIDSNSAIHISVGGGYKKATAILYDLLGKETNKVTINNTPEYIWSLTKPAKGIFLLKVQTEKTTFVKKVVLQ